MGLFRHFWLQKYIKNIYLALTKIAMLCSNRTLIIDVWIRNTLELAEKCKI